MCVCVCVTLTNKWWVFMQLSATCQFYDISLSLSSSFCFPSIWPSLTDTCLWARLMIHLCVCVCVLSLQACVLVSMYMCVHKCVLCSLHALSVEHALSQTCSQPNANWSGSGPAGIEVGVSIDKAVNEVIGRINRGPKGTMSISACWSVSLSKDAGMGVRGDRVQWE